MRKKDVTEFLKTYFRYRKKDIFVFLLFCAIFAVSFYLYHLPLKAVAYPMLLCAVIGAVLLGAGIKNAYFKHKELERLSRLSAGLMDNLPDPQTIEDEDYIQIVEALCSEQRQLSGAMDRRYRDMVDYYTMWAHQIKTPITSMKLHLQKEDTEFSRKMSPELFRIEQYVEMVLTFLRLDSDTTDYVIKECSLDDIVSQAVRKFSGDFINRKLTLEYKPLKAKVITDEKWLSFVIEQVLSNALKYTVNGKISISMEEPKTLCISDTGIGIAAEDLPRIFEKGYSGYNGRVNKRASGIGLYLCKRICGNLGHGITAQSAVDRGTTVRIDLNQKKLDVE